MKREIAHTKALAVSPDGKYIAVAGNAGQILIITYATEEEACVLNGHTKAVTCLAFSHDGQYLASGSEDCSIRLWDMTMLKYKSCIEQKLGAFSGLNSPKDEFETTEEYKQRMDEYYKRAEDAKKSCMTEEAILNEEFRYFKEEEKSWNYRRISVSIDEISAYDADRESFVIRLDTTSYVLVMPVKEAKSFKPVWHKAEVVGIARAATAGSEDYINLSVIHPVSGIAYPFGTQIKPEEDKVLELFLKNHPEK